MAILYGDTSNALVQKDHAGDQLLFGESADEPDEFVIQNTIVGDAVALRDYASGGDDNLYGGGAPFITNDMIGDAQLISGHARGGNDQLTGGGGQGSDTLRGDALEMTDHARGGDDALIGGFVGSSI